MIKLPERIKGRRKAIGMTLAQLADSVGVKEATAQRWESGNIKQIKYEMVEQIAVALGCSPVWLMGWTEDVHGPIEGNPIPKDEDGLDAELIKRLAGLSPEEQMKVDGFVQGLLAARGE